MSLAFYLLSVLLSLGDIIEGVLAAFISLGAICFPLE